MTDAGHSLWYKDAVIYEVHVRAFRDSDGDGIGDFRGLVEKLDYLEDLGVTAIWLLPFYPSPLRDDGYDIADYCDIHPNYGTLRDFRLFLREARRRGLRVITELVLNHTSDQHPWFQRARRSAPGSTWRNYYVWSDTPDRYREARVIFKDFESSNWTWDPRAQAYYWHRFYSHQPDLNYDHPPVRRAMFDVVDFWFEMGVDGVRLDAVPYLFEREGTTCENLPETLHFLEELRRHVDRRFQDRMLLAEANQWPEDAVAYFGEGNRCHMAFHFPLMPRMFMGVRMEDRFPVVDIITQTPPIPETCQWAIFLRNHDELTLEMVTDEERDYMYRMYAEDPQARINLGIRRRLAPLLGNNRRLIEMMNGLLFTLPGTPVIYYGDEIGMGDNIYLGDRNGVRTPMQWSPDRNAGFSRANPQRLYLPVIIDPEYHYEALNVEAQQNNPHSLLWWMKRLVALRKRYRALARGSLEFLYPENRKVLAFLRSHGQERILVVANLSRFAQYVELDLSAFRGMVPVELFGGTEFPPVGDLPYLLTLGPYAFLWFSLEPQRAEVVRGPEAELPILHAARWEDLVEERGRAQLEEVLPSYLAARRWFRSKARRVKTAEVVEAVPVRRLSPDRQPLGTSFLLLVHVEYTEGDPETYVLPLSTAAAPEEGGEPGPPPHAQVARVRTPTGDRLLFDAMADPAFARGVLAAVERRRSFPGRAGKVLASPTSAFRRVRGGPEANLEPQIMHVEQTNTSVQYGDRLVLKLFRVLEEGPNPELEVGRFLTERARFPHVPSAAGALEYARGRRRPATLAVLQGWIPNEGDAWRFTLDFLRRYLDDVLTRRPHESEPELPGPSPLDAAGREVPELAHELLGTYLEAARLLGQRTGELHVALARAPEDPDFAPEPLTDFYRRSLYHSMRTAAHQVFRTLRARAREVPESVQILDLEDEVLRRFRRILEDRPGGMRTRTHGDLHLGQVLYTGRDFVFIDFEGEPARPVSERRIKRSPLRDVAGMVRSFHYAAYTALFGEPGGVTRPENPSFLERWVLFWYLWVSGTYLRAYLEAARAAPTPFLPATDRELETLLDAFLLEKAVYELGYELNHRPRWVKLPIRGILQLLEGRR
ncbi:MAG TPA: maltose alpha-D-glucosyltransferase [Actinomycetota bacterium]|nr:maltose alpha-D-glucosyltransferase [Actinomycetota bacterium]